MSTRNPTHGTKVTDPTAPNINENAGAVASDSLAAQSTTEGGDFSENRGSAPLGVSGSNSTLANKNTSGATKLDPTPEGTLRDDGNDSYTKGDYPAAVGGQSKESAVEYTGGGGVSSSSGTGTASSGGGGSSNADTAPSYVSSQYLTGQGKPKGKNLTEGGFESDDSKNASWNGEIGTKDDPGRTAENGFVGRNEASVGVPKGAGGGGGTQFGVLETDVEGS